MAVDDGGEQARFPCLAILRYMVATVVTVLAVVVIVKMISVGARPEDISLSVVQGCVGTSALWEVAKGFAVVVGPYYSLRGSPTTTTYRRVDNLTLAITLSVDNPSGRGNIRCNSINITFIDMPHGSDDATGTTEIASTRLLTTSFLVKRQSSTKFSRWVPVNNVTVLDHIASAYGGRNSFTGKLQVTMNTSSDTLMAGYHRSRNTRIVNLECWPVDFSMVYASATATSVQCTPS